LERFPFISSINRRDAVEERALSHRVVRDGKPVQEEQ